MSDIATRIRAERKSAGLTQAELAKAAELDQSYVSRLERGEKSPGAEVLGQIAHALGIQVSRLLGEEPARPARKPTEATPAGDPRAGILADPAAQQGLRELAGDSSLVDALGVTAEEWRALHSVQLPGEATKDGFVQLLYTIRAVSRPTSSVTES
jgi:transcriptional regulator with XRE-family HTH domain